MPESHYPDCNDATDHQSMEFGGLCICARLRAAEQRGYREGLSRQTVCLQPWAFVDPPGVLDTILSVIDKEEASDE